MIRDVCFGRVLFHEIGHHIHATMRPEYGDEEDVADIWVKKLAITFMRKKYWFLMPVARPLARLIEILTRSRKV